MEADIVAGAEGGHDTFGHDTFGHDGVRRRVRPRRRVRLPGRHRWAATGLPAVSVLTLSALWLLSAPVAASAATPVTAGTATIIRPATGAPLDSGGSGTAYGVSLPGGASCPGDSATHGYHVYSYLIPQGHNPTEVSFKKEVPSRWYGYISYGAYFGAVNTAQDTGQVMALPPFSWTRYTSFLGDLFPGVAKKATWEGGIVCANAEGVATNYWNTQIVFTRTSADPGGFTWRVVAPPPADPNRTWVVVGITLLVLAVLFGAMAVVLGRRRGREDSPGGDGSGPGPVSPPGPTDSVERLPAPAVH